MKKLLFALILSVSFNAFLLVSIDGPKAYIYLNDVSYTAEDGKYSVIAENKDLNVLLQSLKGYRIVSIEDVTCK